MSRTGRHITFGLSRRQSPVVRGAVGWSTRRIRPVTLPVACLQGCRRSQQQEDDVEEGMRRPRRAIRSLEATKLPRLSPPSATAPRPLPPKSAETIRERRDRMGEKGNPQDTEE
ncbi:hypothetical protein BHE74_00002524 [Ensete ventricosum]|nr:hypothetical protein BHE74_00002524 [Ensete ventricosum]